MNPFFNISTDKNLPSTALQLTNLGERRIYASMGKRSRDGWGQSSIQVNDIYTAVVPEDYDKQFIYKLQKWKPIYELGLVVEHHYNHYLTQHVQGHDEFIKQMRYVILPMLKKQRNAEVCTELFEQWLDQKTPKTQAKPHTVNNNTINVGSVNAPSQFQQNSDHSVQTQHDHYQKVGIKEAFELIKRDIQNVNEQIRKDFAMEMDYAIIQLERDKDIKPQLVNIGALIKAVGMGTFTNLLAAPIFELIKPHLGLS